MVQIHNPDRAEQLSLLSSEELARVRRLAPQLQEEVEAAPREAPCRDGKDRVARKDGYIQDSLPGLWNDTVKVQDVHHSCSKERRRLTSMSGKEVADGPLA